MIPEGVVLSDLEKQQVGERLGWVFLFHYLLDALTQADRPSLLLDKAFPNFLFCAVDESVESGHLARSAADFDFSDLDFTKVDEFLWAFNKIIWHAAVPDLGADWGLHHSLAFTEDQLAAYRSQFYININQLWSPSQVEAKLQEALVILQEMQPASYTAFSEEEVQLRVKDFLEAIHVAFQNVGYDALEESIAYFNPDAWASIFYQKSDYLEQYFGFIFNATGEGFFPNLACPVFHDFMRVAVTHAPLFNSLLTRMQDPANAAFLENPTADFIEGLVTHPRWLPLLGLVVSKGLSVESLEFSNNETLLHRALAYRNYDAAEFLQRLSGGTGALYAENAHGVSPAYYPWWYGDFHKAPSFGPCPTEIEMGVIPTEEDADAALPDLLNDECADVNFQGALRAQAIYTRLLVAAEKVGFKIVPHEVEVMFLPLAKWAHVTGRGTLQISKQLLNNNNSDEAVAFIIAHELGHVLRDDAKTNAATEAEALAENKRVADQYFNGFYDYLDGSFFFAEHAADSIGVLLAMHSGYDLTPFLERSVFDDAFGPILFSVAGAVGIDNHPYLTARDQYIARLIKAHPHWLVK